MPVSVVTDGRIVRAKLQDPLTLLTANKISQPLLGTPHTRE
jgi:hypothetical protein